MVQHKKGTAAKRAQARKDKKAFDVNTGNDSDFDGNSEEMVVQETPQGRKSQMARSMSAKNVSREVSGKKTPGKTPLKNNSFIGKSAAQEVKGRKNKKPQIEEMDDEEENDDFESDMNDDEVEEQEQIQKQKSFSKQQKKDVKTPVKGAEESKKPQTPKAKTPKNQIQEKDQEKDSSEGDDSDEDGDSDEDEDDDSDDDNEQEQIPKQKSNSKRQRNGETPMECADKSEPQMPETKEEKDLKQLYVGNLPLGFTRDELRALSSDIADVIPRAKRCCFLTFASEEKADANYKALQGKELKGQLLNIDYMGAKSKNQKNIEEMNLKSLYVGNLPICATSAQLKALSSDIKDVHMPPDFKKIRRRYAFIRFASEEKADANYESLQGVKLKGQVLKIDYMGQKRWKNPNLRLHISDIPLSASLEDVSAHFPKADEVKFNEEFRYAFVKFLKQKDYDEALNLKEIEIDGCKLEIQQVDSSSKNMRQKGKNKSTSVLQGDSPAKKVKFSKN